MLCLNKLVHVFDLIAAIQQAGGMQILEVKFAVFGIIGENCVFPGCYALFV
jgi:hypothetical protein